MEFELNGFKLIDGKIIPNLLYFYWLDSKIISCKWKNPVNPWMCSDNRNFLCINGL